MSGEVMVGFGHKQAWLAVRDAGADDVFAAMGLRDRGAVSWRAGVDRSYVTDDYLVATPPFTGERGGRWTLVAGRWLLLNESHVDVVKLSVALSTEVQFFATYRVAELHRWERAVDGIAVRAFRYIGEIGAVTDWRGDPDGTELAIGLPPSLDDDPDVLVSERDVMRVAGAWGVDPTTLDGRPAPAPLRAAAPG